ncbi:hypothetical protein B5P45_01855 [Phyllobacterium zundukense]|uniref:Uncharacterized protein n=1 Tax=Phyllobacterium zundukense TaxID=1867719 RepID=A0A2N9W4A0_9HYPH|nr:hypothetical protein BLM14_10225 [Phyllobacterium zundukense]PIO46568.1 hypothetical protein B5P45_01855 [Phyllobacterium zundukense]
MNRLRHHVKACTPKIVNCNLKLLNGLMQLMVFFSGVQGYSGIMASHFSFTYIEYKKQDLK